MQVIMLVILKSMVLVLSIVSDRVTVSSLTERHCGF